MIRVENVWKEYGDQIVLERICLTIAARSFVALVGPSGCGKITFLKMLPDEQTPSRGRIWLDDAPLVAEPGPDRGVVFQCYSVFPHLTVLGNVLLGVEMTARLTGRLHSAARPAPPVQALHVEVTPGGWYWSCRLLKGQALRVAHMGGHASVAMVCWRADQPSERFNLSDTVKVQWTTVISKGPGFGQRTGPGDAVGHRGFVGRA